jgi:hypothetical protein
MDADFLVTGAAQGLGLEFSRYKQTAELLYAFHLISNYNSKRPEILYIIIVVTIMTMLVMR